MLDYIGENCRLNLVGLFNYGCSMYMEMEFWNQNVAITMVHLPPRLDM